MPKITYECKRCGETRKEPKWDPDLPEGGCPGNPAEGHVWEP